MADIQLKDALAAMRRTGIGKLANKQSYKDKPIDYIDPAPKPFEVQIPLVEYFERIKRLKADKWQVHFLNYLQDSVVNRHIAPTWAIYHAQAQLGKTICLSQVFPAWCLGHDPMWRTTLAMYNVSRSQVHSSVVIQIMQSLLHKDIFPHKDGHLPKLVSKEGWLTNARRQIENTNVDGQKSFSACGLQSGITGISFDYLIIDDPYKEPKDAWSPTVYDNLERFWEYGVDPRLSDYSCIAAMFHRYTYDDFGGYLLNTGKFDYVRYASIADGDYLHDDTGQIFHDPLGRSNGELISPERFPVSYYDSKKSNPKVWMSMFQGRPSSEEGDFFKVNMLGTATDGEWATCSMRGRGWDHAATADGGDKSAGGLGGMLPDETFIIADMFSGQLDSAKRVAKQKELALADGTDTVIVIPEDKGASGKDVVFFLQQELRDFTVVARPVTNAAPGSDAKQRRAYNLSVAVNSGRVRFAPDNPDAPWHDRLKRLMRNFGATASGDDEIDALSDLYNHLYEQHKTGLVVKNWHQGNIITGDNFQHRFDTAKIPANWTLYAGVKITPEATRPNSAVIVARAAQNTGLADTLFIVAEYKEYTGDFYLLFDWLKNTFEEKCEPSTGRTIWLHPESSEFKMTIWQKLKITVHSFDGTPEEGLTEMNWYLRPLDDINPFNSLEKASKMYAIVDEDQKMVARDVNGFVNLRQEAATWAMKDGMPNGVGAVMDCVRMVAFHFRTTATGLTAIEKAIENKPEAYKNPIDDHDKIKANLWMQSQMRQIETAKNNRRPMGSSVSKWRGLGGKK